ncbi:GroES-like protein [Xylaria nigripes]|nr:GroES-like protein [Xylaria nigripes]
MATGKALVLIESGKVEIQEVPLPKIRDGHILVKVRAVAINPTDWKGIDSSDPIRLGTRPGCDYAGEVVEIGPGVTKDFRKGDRVSGLIFGSSPNSPDSGAFGEFATAKEHLTIKTPANVSDEEAATLGVSVTTVAQGLYRKLQLPLPNNPATTPFPVLIYGGSTATGLYGIKFAKASGLTVITTASPHNFALVRAAGADHVFDYKVPGIGAQIRALTENKLLHAWDCTGLGAAVCAAALSAEGRPKYATILPVQREVVEGVNAAVEGPLFSLAYSAVGEDFSRFGDRFGPDLEEVGFVGRFWEMVREMLESGRLVPLRPEVNRGGSGLDGVLKGLDELKRGRVSGGKLVYSL